MARASRTVTLALAFTAVVVVILGAGARRRGLDAAAVDAENHRRDLRVLGRALERSFERTWREEGLSRAVELLAAADARTPEVAIEVTDEVRALREVDEATVRRWERDAAVQRCEAHALRTSVRLDGPAGERRALALTTSLRGSRAHVREALAELAQFALIVLCLATAAALWLRHALWDRRVGRLVARARSIVAGDLTQRALDRGHDELGELAAALEEAARALADARRRREDGALSTVAATGPPRAEHLAGVTTLAAGLATTLRAPLDAIYAGAHRLARAVARDDDLRSGAAALVEHSARVRGIVDALRDFAAAPRRSPAPVDLDALVDAELLRLAPRLRLRSVVAAHERRSGPAAVVLADAAQLRQLLAHLLVNALQATPEGGAFVIDRERAQPAPRELLAEDPTAARRRFTRLRVRDCGPGIDAAALPRLYDPFFTTREVGEGRGLGLAVAHGLVRAQGGWIAAESELGRGSVFLLWLPERPASAGAADP
ncbi:MAG: ATP-binding protein [Nannocystaceae bacterium]